MYSYYHQRIHLRLTIFSNVYPKKVGPVYHPLTAYIDIFCVTESMVNYGHHSSYLAYSIWRFSANFIGGESFNRSLKYYVLEVYRDFSVVNTRSLMSYCNFEANFKFDQVSYIASSKGSWFCRNPFHLVIGH